MRMLSVVLLAALVVTGCSRSETSPNPHHEATSAATKPSKDPALAKQRIAEGAVVLDVRTPDEFAAGHLPNAVNVPIGDLPSRMPEVDKLAGGDHGRSIVVYCQAGGRAAKAKTQLEAAGYSQVVNGGGLDDLAP